MSSKNAALSKKQFLSEVAPESIKKASKIGLICTLVSLIFLLSCYISFANKSIEKIPLLKMVNVKTNGAEDGFDEAADILDEILDENDDLSKKEQRAIKKLQKSFEKLSKTFSINNIKGTFKAYIGIKDIVIDENLDMDFAEDIYETLKTISNVVLWLFILVCAPFVLLGGLFRVNILVVLGMILTTIFTAILCGWLFVVLSIALHIIIIVFNSKVNSAYKEYKSSLA